MLEILMNESLNGIDNEFSFTLKQSKSKTRWGFYPQNIKMELIKKNKNLKVVEIKFQWKFSFFEKI